MTDLPPHILIADDQPENQAILEALLGDDYTLHAASDGQQVLEFLDTGSRVDLILLDVMMPRMDGFEVCRRIKANPDTRNIPVLFLSGLESAADETHGFSLGAEDFIHKPFSPPVVLARVRNHLELKRARDRLARENVELEAKIAERTRAIEQAQSQLLQSEKMAALGQLAAGVAHEINNPVGFVSSNFHTLQDYLGSLLGVIDFAERDLAPKASPDAAEAFRQYCADADVEFVRQDIHNLITESSDGLERVRHIVADLKGFAHSDDQEWTWSNLHQGLESTLNVVWNELKYKAEVIRNYGELPEVFCLPKQINQVLMNLLVNAAHAIETRGRITISSGNGGEGEVWLEIRDTGKGIAAENLKHIFEPFFTTKPVGQGTGLGLSIAWTIVAKHQGRIEVESEPGVGTTFRMTLPVRPSVAVQAGP